MGLFNSRSGQGAQPSPYEPFDPLTALLPPTAGPPVPVRLSLVTPAGPTDWMPGTMRINPGSVVWVPDPGVRCVPVELATAPMAPAAQRRRGYDVIELQTSIGQVQLEHDGELFAMVQEMAAEMAAKQPPGDQAAPWV